MDQQALKNADVLILSGLTQTPTANPDSMLGDLCVTAGELKNNQSTTHQLMI
jgi:integrator complex subunit 9